MTKKPWTSLALASGLAFGGAGCSKEQPRGPSTEQIDARANEIIDRLMDTIIDLGYARDAVILAGEEGMSSIQHAAQKQLDRAQANFAEKQKLLFDNQSLDVQEAVVKELERRQEKEQHGSVAWLGFDEARSTLEYVLASILSAGSSVYTRPLEDVRVTKAIDRLMPEIEGLASLVKIVDDGSSKPESEEALAKKHTLEQNFRLAKERFALAVKEQIDLEPLEIRQAVVDNLRTESFNWESHTPENVQFIMRMAADVLEEYIKGQSQSQGRGGR